MGVNFTDEERADTACRTPFAAGRVPEEIEYGEKQACVWGLQHLKAAGHHHAPSGDNVSGPLQKSSGKQPVTGQPI